MTKSQAQAERDVAWDGWTCPHQQERSFSFTFLSSQVKRAGTRKVVMDQLMIGSSFLSPQNLAVWCLHNTSHASVILNLPLIQQPFSRNVVRIYLRNNIKTGLSMACVFPDTFCSYKQPQPIDILSQKLLLDLHIGHPWRIYHLSPHFRCIGI